MVSWLCESAPDQYVQIHAKSARIRQQPLLKEVILCRSAQEFSKSTVVREASIFDIKMLKMGPLMPRLIFILVWLSFAKSQLIRHYNGTGNNLGNPTWGSANTPFLRIIPANYADNISQPNGADRPSARAISELLHKGKDAVVGEGGFNAFVVFFAEAIVFDTLRSTTNTSEPFPIPVPSCDSDYDAGCTGNQTLALFRQASTLVNGQRVGVNLVTSFLDANFLYGVSEEIATSIRTGNDGLLKIGNDGFPEQINGSAIVADTRIFKNPGVQTVHLLLLREHNRRARLLRAQYPSWTDEELFQTARKWVVGIWQKFVFNQYVPTLIGGPLPDYGGYIDSINPGTDSFYMGCSMRYGHSVVPTFITLIGDDGKPLAASPLVLQDHLDTSSTMRRYGIEPILRGLVSQKEGEMDTLVTRELRKLTKSGPMDVPAFNIQRGRDLGLPSYNKAREYFGLGPAASFSDITRKLDVQELLSQIYAGDISKVDAWVGAIAEDNYPGSRVGPLMRASLMETFLRLRDGDRFYYLNPNSGYTASDVRDIENFTFAQLVTSNTNISLRGWPESTSYSY
ncbi:heme peroxidase [Paraphysoderma sedebokerense]|nr:heme peroxidase [Paraphysoderma sedebokerense]